MPKYTVRWCEENWFETSVEARDRDHAQDIVFGNDEGQVVESEPYDIKTTYVLAVRDLAVPPEPRR